MPRSPALHDGPDDSAEAGDGLDALVMVSAAAQALTVDAPDEALALLEAAARLTPPDATALFLAGVAHMQLGEMDTARSELESAVALDPQDTATRCVLARACAAQGDLQAAVMTLVDAVSIDPDQARLHTLLGRLYLEQDDVGDAYDSLMRAVELDPSDSDAHRGLGVLFMRADEPDRAEHAFRQAARLQPDDALLQVGLGNALREQGRDAEALVAFRRAAELEPEAAAHHANIASTLFSLGRLPEARAEFEQALARPMSAGLRRALVHFDFAMLLERLGDQETATEEFEFALEDDPECAPAHEALGLLCLDRGHEDEAMRHLDAALELSGLGAEAALRLALLHEARGEPEAARRCAELLAAADPGDPEVAFRRAQLLVLSADPEVRDPGTAIEIVRGLLRATPTGSGALWNLLGEALARQGAYEDALDAADHALQSAAPGDPSWQLYTSRRTQYLSRLVGR